MGPGSSLSTWPLTHFLYVIGIGIKPRISAKGSILLQRDGFPVGLCALKQGLSFEE